MEERIETDGKNPDNVVGKARIIQCIYCSKTAYSIAFNDHEPNTPEGWHAVTQYIAPGIDQQIGYLCPDCLKEMNKPFSYSLTVNGEVVHASKTIPLFTITPFKDEDDD